jgi:hypothetical protein
LNATEVRVNNHPTDERDVSRTSAYILTGALALAKITLGGSEKPAQRDERWGGFLFFKYIKMPY